MLELAVPAWNSGLTKEQSDQIERVQKLSARIILGDFTISYRAALSILGLETLQNRRFKVSKNFAMKLSSRDIVTCFLKILPHTLPGTENHLMRPNLTPSVLLSLHLSI